jgi:hypothetical protein
VLLHRGNVVLSVIVLGVVMSNIQVLNVVVLNVALLSVIFGECCCTECHWHIVVGFSVVAPRNAIAYQSK